MYSSFSSSATLDSISILKLFSSKMLFISLFLYCKRFSWYSISFLSSAIIFCCLIISLMLLFFISSCSFCIFIILSFLALSSFKFWASLIYCIYLFWFYCMILFLFASRYLALFSSLFYSSSSLCYWSCNLLDLSASFLYLILTTCSAFFFVSSIFFQAFFSSNFNKAILFANSLASS